MGGGAAAVTHAAPDFICPLASPSWSGNPPQGGRWRWRGWVRISEGAGQLLLLQPSAVTLIPLTLVGPGEPPLRPLQICPNLAQKAAAAAAASEDGQGGSPTPPQRVNKRWSTKSRLSSPQGKSSALFSSGLGYI